MRDRPGMAGLTLALTVFGIGWKGQGRINRLEAVWLLATFIAYTTWLVVSVIGGR
ncbi:hypothetical protein [Chromohalobacter sp. 48-RD10]|uniref:hypothetical protein n=1 Tax=Chromohalobacter sp. 48-RD10 TaxID=2994063 RepID=UPI0024692F0B|nr:hypothetical protein [Chromohalobacter sp. 48-RD10]